MGAQESYAFPSLPRVPRQEVHTAHLTEEDTGEEFLAILNSFANIYEKLLVVPVIKGRKTLNEQFPGAHYTTTIEGYIPATGRDTQAATSHYLGLQFSKIFNITVEDPSISEDGKKNPQVYVWRNCRGCTTRSICIIVLTHGYNKRLTLLPRVAQI